LTSSPHASPKHAITYPGFIIGSILSHACSGLLSGDSILDLDYKIQNTIIIVLITGKPGRKFFDQKTEL